MTTLCYCWESVATSWQVTENRRVASIIIWWYRNICFSSHMWLYPDHLGYPSREFKGKLCRLGFQRDLFPLSVNIVSKRREILVYSSRNSYFWHIVAEIINKSILQLWGESREHGSYCQTSICSQTSPWCIMSTIPSRHGPGVAVLNKCHIDASLRGIRITEYPELKGAHKDHQLNSWLQTGTRKIQILCLLLLSKHSSKSSS